MSRFGFILFFIAITANAEQLCQNKVTIATIDTGIDLKNEYLVKFIKKDAAGNLVGENTINKSDSIQDRNGHGTQIADIITKISKCAELIPIIYWDETTNSKLDSFVLAIERAITYKPNIINISGGGNVFSEREYSLLKETESRGIIIVSAAGNDGKNTDFSPNRYFPGSYQLPNIITVSAVDSAGELGRFSNFGLNSVHISAHGVDVATSGLNNKTTISSGTSQATAYVSGVVANLLTVDKSLTGEAIKNIIITTADKKSDLIGKSQSGGVINEARAIAAIKSKKFKKGNFSTYKKL